MRFQSDYSHTTNPLPINLTQDLKHLQELDQQFTKRFTAQDNLL